MDIGANVFSILICKRLFKIINKHGVNTNLDPPQELDVRKAPSQSRKCCTRDITTTCQVISPLSIS